MTAILRPYIPASWFHPIGIKKVVAKLLPKLPDVSGCLFITLTIDRNLFATPESAFEVTRQQIRKLFFQLRKGVPWEGKTIQLDVPYFIKVEFHEDGWPHFHIVFLTRRYLPGKLLRTLWKHGRPNVKRIRKKRFHYLLKYVTKGASIPEWVLNRKRVRIVQASHGFYKSSEKEAVSKRPRRKGFRRKTLSTIGERICLWERMVIAEHDSGIIETSKLPIPYHEFLGRHVLSFAQAGLYLGNAKLKLKTQVIKQWKNEIRKRNAESSYWVLSFPVRHASLLERMGLAVP